MANWTSIRPQCRRHGMAEHRRGDPLVDPSTLSIMTRAFPGSLGLQPYGIPVSRDSVRTGSFLGEVGESGDHENIWPLMRCGERSEFGPHCGPLDPTNDDVFYNHRLVSVLQRKGDSIPGT
jgi:hypothetical protein